MEKQSTGGNQGQENTTTMNKLMAIIEKKTTIMTDMIKGLANIVKGKSVYYLPSTLNRTPKMHMLWLAPMLLLRPYHHMWICGNDA